MEIASRPAASHPSWRAWFAGHWILLFWLLTAVIVNLVAAMMIPETMRLLRELAMFPASDRDVVGQRLAEVGLSPNDVAWFSIGYNVLHAAIRLGIGWMLIRSAPRTRFVTFFAFVLAAQTSLVYPPWIDDVLPGQPAAQTIARVTTVFAVSGFFILPLVFPDGRFVPRWTMPWALYLVIGVTEFVFDRTIIPITIPPAVNAVGYVLLVCIAIGSMIYRYRNVSTAEQRRQTRWVLLGLIVGFPATVIPSDILALHIGASVAGIAILLLSFVILPLAELAPTVAIAIGVMHHRLFDIDVVLSRTLLWLAMSAAITGAYIGIVLGLGSLFGSEDRLLLSLLATALVAIGFQPARQRVQRFVDRLLFGERDDPYAVLTRLGQEMEGSRASVDLLTAIVHTTAEMLRLPYVGLLLDRPGGPALVAASGAPVPGALRVPLVYQGLTIGALDVAPRAPGQALNRTDRQLLEDLARQIAAAAQTVTLAADLQHSREQIVSSREEERRRLRRDLHDGLGAQLAALIMQAGAARSLVRSDPGAAERELAELREELRGAVADVRRLVQGLRPPALDELGLEGALRLRLERLDRGGVEADGSALRVALANPAPLPPLGAAVEVAAFRIVEEAVTNAVKHARAATVTVTLLAEGDTLRIAVVDDGIGLALSPGSGGVGLLSMRERATELGGDFTVGIGADGRGTAVRVALPCRPTVGG